jgi:hypothetical protein
MHEIKNLNTCIYFSSYIRRCIFGVVTFRLPCTSNSVQRGKEETHKNLVGKSFFLMTAMEDGYGTEIIQKQTLRQVSVRG